MKNMQPNKPARTNALGRRIGEDHPRAVLTDHEVDLLCVFLAERDALIQRLMAGGATRPEIDAALRTAGLSYRLLAIKFEVGKSAVQKIAQGQRRCQIVMVD